MSNADAPVRTALVGYGSAGRGIHAPLLRAVAGLQVRRVVTGDRTRAAAARAELPGVAVDSAFADLVPHLDEVDLVVLASPNPVHAAQAEAVIGTGTAVVVDKPLAVDAAQARRLVTLARDGGVPLTVFQNRRWDPAHRAAREVLASGALGQVIRCEARFERWRPVPKSRWREQLGTADGGGLLLDLQSHLVDGVVDLFGPVVSVHAELAAITTPADDVTFLALRHASGVTSHLGATSLAGAPGPRLRVLGAGGSFLVQDVDEEAAMTATEPSVTAAPTGFLVRGDDRAPVSVTPGTWASFYVAVVSWLRSGGPVPVDPEDAVHVMEVLDAARRSAGAGTVEAVAPPARGAAA